VSRVAAVIFDLDGVLLDSERVWNAARERVARGHGGQWPADAIDQMMGMSSPEWSGYMHDQLGVPLPPADINARVVSEMEQLYRERLPLLPGAREAVIRLAAVWPLGLATSSNRPIIDMFLELSSLTHCFAVTVSSEEVARGKPAPDVYLDAARKLGVSPAECVAIEDSANGIRSGAAAGMIVIAVPNRDFPPDADALALAAGTQDSVGGLTSDCVEAAARSRRLGTNA
jgi:HAD superfamily hydrolase (TIGR01509 family)